MHCAHTVETSRARTSGVAAHTYRLRKRLGNLAAWCAVAVVGLWATAANATVVGTYPSTPKAFKVHGKAVQLGASLVTNFTDYRFNDKLKPESADTIKTAQKLPQDAVIVGAFLFWGGSAANTGIDDVASFTAADGFASQVTADSCDSRTDTAGSGQHFLCRKDVTALVAAHPGVDNWNGTYKLGDVSAKVAAIKLSSPGDPCLPKSNGSPEDVCCQGSDAFCQARHASWSLVLLYDTKFSEATERDIFLYDGFVLLDENASSTGQVFFSINQFLVGDPPDAQLSYYAMEGDKQLGNPAQDPPGTADSPPCATCFDFVQFNGTKLTGGAGNNDANNIMNSTPEAGVDLDNFDISSLVKTGDTSATFLVSSGNGSLADNTNPVIAAGAGEMFLYAYTLLQINRKAPNFKNIVSGFVVNASEVSGGEELTFTIDLLNNGQLDAETSTLKLGSFPPPGLQYVAGSTTVDGKAVADVGGTSAVSAGLSLGNITNQAGGNSLRKVTLKFKVLSPPGVNEINSFPVLTYKYKGSAGSTVVYDGEYIGPTAVVKVVAPKLATPTLSVNPTTAQPGASVQYTLGFNNVGTTQVQMAFDWTAPKELKLGPAVTCSADTLGATSKITVDTTGGANGSGLTTATGLVLAAGKTGTCTWTATVLSAAELTTKGISPINGHAVLTQVAVAVDGKSVLTDDPQQAGPSDQTKLLLSAQSSFVSSSKSVADLSPGTPLLPGDDVQFTMTLVNSGQVAGTVNLTDPLPSALTFVSSASPELVVNGSTIQASNVVVAAGATKTLVFTAKIKPATPPGTTFANVATVSPTDGAAPVVIQTAQQTVQGGPDLATSTKAVVDENGGDLEPGDTLNFALTFKNQGKTDTGTFQVVDPIDANLTDITKISAGGAFDAGAKQITWTVPPIAPGGQAVLTFSAKVGTLVPTGTTIANKATASGGELSAPVAVSTSIKVQAQPNISLFSNTVVSSSGGAFNPGDTVTYTYNVQNSGSGAVTKAVLASSFDPALQIVSASAGGKVSGQTITWDLATLQKGQQPVTVTVTAKLPAVVAQSKAFTNQAQLTGEGLGAPALSDDPKLPGAADPTVFQVTSAPALVSSQKSFSDANGGQVQGGDQVTFKIAIANTGNAPATNVVVTDTLAPQLVQVVVQGGTFDAASRKVTWNAIAAVNPGDKPIELTVVAVVDKATPSATVVNNFADIAFNETPKAAKTNTVSFSVVNLPDFGASTKAVSAQVVGAGESFTWTLQIVNSGNQSGSNVVVTDALPTQAEGYVLSDGGTLDGTGKATWNLGTLAAGATKTLTISAKLKKPLDKGIQVCNQAAISATEATTPSGTSPPGVVPKPAGEPTCFSVDAAPKLTVTKDVFDAKSGAQLNGGVAKPKQVLRWQIKVANTGNALAKDVAVTDVAPTGLTDLVPLDGGKLDAGGKVLSWPVAPTLGTGAADVLVFRFEGTVSAGADNGTPIANQAQATLTGGAGPVSSDDPTTAAKDDPTQVVVQSNVDFSKAKLVVVDDNGGDARPGDALTYTLTVANDGDGTGKDVTVILPLDSKLEGVTADNSGVVASGVITWKLGTMVPGGGATLKVTAKLKKPLVDGAVVSEQAQILASGFGAPILSDADLATPVREPTTLKVVAKTDFSTSAWQVKDLNGGPYEPGDVVQLELTLRNTGDALAQLLQVAAVLQPNTLNNLSAFDGGKIGGGQIQWTVPVVGLSPQGDVKLVFQGTIAPLPNGTQIAVVAQIPGLAQNPTANLTVSAIARFDNSAVTVDDESGWVGKIGLVAPGHVLRIEALVVNSGKGSADNLVVTLPLPAAVGQLQIVTAGGVQQGNSVAWALPALPAGGSAKFVAKIAVAATAKDGDVLPFSASINATGLPEPKIVLGPPSTVVVRPILKLTKTYEDLTGKHVFPGDTVRFNIVAANVGNAAAPNLVITDAVPVAIVGLEPESGGVANGQTVTWTIPSLPAGQQVTVAVRGKIAAGVPSGSTIVNTASCKADLGDPATSNALSVPVLYPTLDVQLGLVPEAPAKLPLQPGDTVTLQVQVTAVKAGASEVKVVASVDTSVFDVVGLQGAAFDDKAKTLTWVHKDAAVLAALELGKPVLVLAALKVKATAADGSKPVFTATATEGETGLSYSAPQQTVPISAQPKLAVTKTVTDLNGGKVHPLDVLRYDITVQVVGKAAAQAVTVGDLIDGLLEIIAVGQGGKTTLDPSGAALISWDSATTSALGVVLPGNKVTLTFDARVKATANDGQVIANVAQTAAQGLAAALPSDDPSLPGDADPTLATVRVTSSLESSEKTGKDDDGAPLLTGQTITWRVLVSATGDKSLEETKVYDAVPPGTDYVAGSTKVAGQTVPDAAGNSLPLAQGLVVQSAGAAVGVVNPGPTQAVAVTFQTRVRADTPDGTVVSNTATVISKGQPPVALGPASLVVGKAPSLKTTLKFAEVQDTNGNGVADVGEEVRFVVRVANAGGAVAQAVLLEDPLAPNAQYVGGSLQVGGAGVTDAADLDPGQYDATARKITCKLGDLGIGQSKDVAFRIRVLLGPQVLNQGTVSAKGLSPEHTDADGDDSNGDQPTIVVIAGAGSVLQVVKSVQDDNGGQVLPGDTLRYTIVVSNPGLVPVAGATLLDPLPVGLQPIADKGQGAGDLLLPPGVQAAWEGTVAAKPPQLRVVGLQVQPGESATIAMRVVVDAKAQAGLTMCNVAKATLAGGGDAAGKEFVSKPACASVGAVVGQGLVRGAVFEDVGAQDGVFQASADVAMPGFQVQVLPLGGEGSVIAALADKTGQFQLQQVPEGKRTVRVLSGQGVVYREFEWDAPGSGGGELPIAVKPTGRVYDAKSAELVGNVRVLLSYDPQDPVAPGQPVPADELPPGQQGQVTDATGAYLFSPKPGRAYRIDVAATAAGRTFPSLVRQPEGVLALLAGDGFVVAEALPKAGATLPKYLTRFSLQGKADPVPPRHNHLPVDKLSAQLHVAVRLTRGQAQVGELVGVTVKVVNASNTALVADALTGHGGVELRQVLPVGLRYVPGTARVISKKAAGTAVDVPVGELSGQLLTVRKKGQATGGDVGLDLPAGGEITLTLLAAVGTAAAIGTEQTTVVQLFDTGGAALSDRATASVQVVADPIFDRAAVMAKVFCDSNGNGDQDAGEDGLPGVRLHSDTGEFAASDVHGRLHFVNLPGGSHLFKLDADTLPPGSEAIGDSKKVAYLTRGVMLSLQFPIKCALEVVGPGQVQLAPPDDVSPVAQGPGVVLVEGDTRSLDIAIDGKKLSPRWVHAVIAQTGDRPAKLAWDATAVVLGQDGELAVWAETTGSFAKYALEIRAVTATRKKGDLLWESLQTGDVPRKVAFVLPAGEGNILKRLEPGQKYALRLRGETAHGSRALSALLPFEVRKGSGAPALGNWQIPSVPVRASVNGHGMLVEEHLAVHRVLRPDDGKLLVGLRTSDGRGRDEFMTLPKPAAKDAVPLPVLAKVDPAAAAAKLPAAVLAPKAEPPAAPAPKVVPAPVSIAPEPAPVAPKPAPVPAVAPPAPATAAAAPAATPAQVAPAPAPAPAPAVPKATLPAPAPAPAEPVPVAAAPAPAPATPPPAPAPAVALPAPAPRPEAPAPKPEPAPVARPEPAAVAPTPAAPAVPGTALAATARGLKLGTTELVGRVGNVQLGAPAVPVPLGGGRVLGQLMLSVQGVPADARSAALVLLDARGTVMARSNLTLPAPSNFLWAPSAVGLPAGKYGLAIEVLQDDAGGLAGWRSPATALVLAASGTGLVPTGEPDKNVRATLYDDKSLLTDSAMEWLGKLAATIKGDTKLDANRIAVVTVHDDGPGDGLGRSEKAARTVDKILGNEGAPRDKLIVFGVGASVPDSKPGRAAIGPHRIELRWRGLNTASSEPATERFALPTGLWVDDRRVGAPDGLPAELNLNALKPTRILWQKGDGAAAIWMRSPTPARPGAAATPTVPQGAGRDVSEFGAELLDGLAADSRAAEAGKKRTPVAGGETAIKLGEGTTETTLPAAADFQVWLPPAGKEFSAPELALRGRTRPGNKVHVGAQEVPVAADGSFYALVPLPVGPSTLTMTSTDPRGNKATLQRNVTVKDRALFLLAIADTSASHVAAHLVDIERDGGNLGWVNGAWQVGSAQLLGRGALYAKGRVAGQYLGLKDLQFTAHLDTTKNPQLGDFATNLLDPTRFYPVYGDASPQTQDVQSRGKLYVLVEAEQGKLQVGNLRAQVQGIELLRYDRALYGARMELRPKLVAGEDTKVIAFGAQQDRLIARRSDVLRGTGGSLYYLSARDVIEGSERIELVVRDRQSGLELMRLPQARNNDYTIDYREGRLLFKSPVTSAVDGGLALGQMALGGQHATWNGQPVTLEVLYESRGAVSGDDAAFGGQVRQSAAGGAVSVGASYVQEGRGETAAAYRAVGADLTVKLGQTSKASVEWAYTQSRDTQLSVSDDGGLSFAAPKGASPLAQPTQGHGVKAQIDVNLGDFGSKAEPAALPKGETPVDLAGAGPGRLRAWWQWVAPGLQTGGVVAQQAQQRFGGDVNLVVSPRNALTIRYDGLLSDAQASLFSGVGLYTPPAASAFAALNRHSLVVQDTHKIDPRWTSNVAASWGLSLDPANQTTAGHHAAGASAGLAWRATDRLTLRLDQQVVAMGDPALVRSWGDRLISAFGAEYKLDKTLALTLSERLGWAGQNSTAAGLRTWIDKDTSLYAQQRLEDTLQTGRPTSATVVGAEARYGKDQTSRAFAEYQMDALGTGAQNRAVMGVGKRFLLGSGLTLDAGYERQQVFTGPAGALGRDALSVGAEWLAGSWWKATTRQEVRLDEGDSASGGLRKAQVLSLNNAQLALGKELTLFGRAHIARTQDQTNDRVEAEAIETTLALAYRPITSNWLNMLGKVTRLVEQRPSNDNQGAQLHSDKWIASLEPAFEAPYRLQFSPKIAYQYGTERFADYGLDIASEKLLTILRLGWHATPELDLAGEWRYLTTPLVQESRQGALVELAYLFAKAVRVGAGYNFSRIVQGPAGDIRTTADDGGFFVRLMGLY